MYHLIFKTTRRSDTGDFDLKKNPLSSVVIDVNYGTRFSPSPVMEKSYKADRVKDRMPFKQSILLVCDQRNDLPADDVRLRVQGAASDFHAAGAQYHLDCHNAFISPRAIESTHEKPLKMLTP